MQATMHGALVATLALLYVLLVALILNAHLVRALRLFLQQEVCAHAKLLTDSIALQELVWNVLRTPFSGQDLPAGVSANLASQ